jgi:hypothetical protein
MNFRRTALLAGLLSVASVGCAIDEKMSEVDPSTTTATVSASPQTTTSSAAPGSSIPVEPAVPEAYDLTAPLVGGGLINLAGYSNDTVVLWFWAPY